MGRPYTFNFVSPDLYLQGETTLGIWSIWAGMLLFLCISTDDQCAISNECNFGAFLSLKYQRDLNKPPFPSRLSPNHWFAQFELVSWWNFQHRLWIPIKKCHTRSFHAFHWQMNKKFTDCCYYGSTPTTQSLSAFPSKKNHSFRVLLLDDNCLLSENLN